MGLNVGGIYVRSDDQATVVAAVKEFWLGVGATPAPADDDVLGYEPLSVQKTGKLGYVACPAGEGADGTIWVAIYDSERYHASDELAQALARKLGTQVLLFGFWSTVDEARLTVYDSDATVIEQLDDWDAVEERVELLPFGALYYNKLAELDPEALEPLAVFGFANMPFREGEYRGPSHEEMSASARK